MRPYYLGWIIQKESVWADDINMHLLLCHQVIYTVTRPHFLGYLQKVSLSYEHISSWQA